MDNCKDYINSLNKKEKVKTKKYKMKDIFKGKEVKNKNKVVAIIKKN